jgi:hypothetical protein
VAARDELLAVTAEDVFAQFEHGDGALRQVLRQWRENEPDLSPASISDEIERWRAFHAERIADGGAVRLYRALRVAPGHWNVAKGMAATVGRHWSLVEDQAWVIGGGLPRDGEHEYLLTAEVAADAAATVDWPATLAANVAFGDQEHEIVLRAGVFMKPLGIRDLETGASLAPPPVATAASPVPSTESAPPFAPRIRSEGGSLYYDDGRVSGAVDEYVTEDGRRGIVIHEWNSHLPGRGHSAAALTWLRTRYDQISANGIGSLDEDGVGDISVNYWERIREKGLVDVLILDDGSELPRPGAPKP